MSDGAAAGPIRFRVLLALRRRHRPDRQRAILDLLLDGVELLSAYHLGALALRRHRAPP
jgi:hypothetical protein